MAAAFVGAENDRTVREGLGDFYAFFAVLRDMGLQARGNLPAWPPIQNIVTVHDVKAVRLLTGKGGAFCNTLFACHLCGIHRLEIVQWKEGEERCDRCKKNNWEQFRHMMVDNEEEITPKRGRLEAILFEELHRAVC